MPRFEPVDDPDDPRLAEVAGLTDAAARAHVDTTHGCFVIEGALALEAAVASPYPLRTVLVAEHRVERIADVLADTDVTVFVGSRALLETVTGFPIHRGIIASGGRLPLPDPAALVAGATRVAVLEGINDHENIGALFRNAAAFGVDAVLLDRSTADPLYRRSVRVSLGHVLGVPWTRIDDLPAALAMLTDAGLATCALTPAGDVSIHDLDPTAPVAWLLGAEGPGLTDAAMAAAVSRVRIPIASGVDSLNIATAAAVAFAISGPRR